MRADARRNYEALVDTARDVFLELGSDAPLDEIARRAGVGSGTLYRHFPTRADLLAAVYFADIDEFVVRADRLEGLEAGKALSEYMGMYLEMGMRNGAIKKALKEVMAATAEQPKLMVTCRTQMAEATDRILGRAQRAGAAREDLDSTTLMRMVHGISVASEENEEMAQSMLNVMRAGVLTSGPAPKKSESAELA